MSLPDQARLVDSLLAVIEKGSPDQRLRELATGLRSGDAGWAESLRSAVYAEALQPGLDGFTAWHDQLDETERAEHAERYSQANGH